MNVNRPRVSIKFRHLHAKDEILLLRALAPPPPLPDVNVLPPKPH